MIRVIRWLIEKRLRAVEFEQGMSLAYLRHILRVSPPHFLKFMKVMPLARFRRALPPEAYHIARIVTASHEDCGTCLQMEVHLAKQDGVRVPLLHAVLDESPCSLPPELAEVYFFAEAVATGNGEEETWREAIFRPYGEIGLVEFSMAIAVSRMFPTVLHAMGYAALCTQSNTQFGALDRWPPRIEHARHSPSSPLIVQ
jgi:alkylhydroperoxidase family enzyme